MKYFFNRFLLFLLLLLTSCRWSINKNDSYLVYKNKIGSEYILKKDFFIKKSSYYEKFILVDRLYISDKNYIILSKGTRIKLIGRMFKWHIKYFSDGNGFSYYRILTGRLKGKITAQGTYIDSSNLRLIKKIKHPKDIPLIYTEHSRNKKIKVPNYSNLNHINDPALPPFKDRIILKSSDFGF